MALPRPGDDALPMVAQGGGSPSSPPRRRWWPSMAPMAAASSSEQRPFPSWWLPRWRFPLQVMAPLAPGRYLLPLHRRRPLPQLLHTGGASYIAPHRPPATGSGRLGAAVPLSRQIRPRRRPSNHRRQRGPFTSSTDGCATRRQDPIAITGGGSPSHHLATAMAVATPVDLPPTTALPHPMAAIAPSPRWRTVHWQPRQRCTSHL